MLANNRRRFQRNVLKAKSLGIVLDWWIETIPVFVLKIVINNTLMIFKTYRECSFYIEKQVKLWEKINGN